MIGKMVLHDLKRLSFFIVFWSFFLSCSEVKKPGSDLQSTLLSTPGFPNPGELILRSLNKSLEDSLPEKLKNELNSVVKQLKEVGDLKGKEESLKLKEKSLVIFFHGLNDEFSDKFDSGGDFDKLKSNLEKYGGPNLNFIFAPKRKTESTDIKSQSLEVYSVVFDEIKKEYKNICLIGYSMGGLVATEVMRELLSDNSIDRQNINLCLSTLASPLGGIDDDSSVCEQLEKSLNETLDDLYSTILGNVLSTFSKKEDSKNLIREQIVEKAKGSLPNNVKSNPKKKGVCDMSREIRESVDSLGVDTLNFKTKVSMSRLFIKMLQKKLSEEKKLSKESEISIMLELEKSKNFTLAESNFLRLLGCKDSSDNDGVVPFDIQASKKVEGYNFIEKELFCDHLSAPRESLVAIDLLRFLKRYELKS